MSSEPFESTLELSRTRRGALLAAACVGVLALASFVVLLALPAGHGWRALGLALTSLLSSVLVAGALFLFGHRARRMQARLRADETGLSAGGARLLPRAEIRTGYLQPPSPQAPQSWLVRLVGRRAFDRIDVAVRDEAEGARLLSALALDPSRSVAHFRVRQGLFANKKAQATLSAIIMTFGYQAQLIMPSPLKGPAVVILVVLAILNFLPSRMSIGADGVLVASMVRRKFYSFANVASVEPSAWGVVLVTRKGQRVELRTRVREVKGAQMLDATTMAIVARIQAGISAQSARSGAAADPAALVARGPRTYEAWVSSLRELTGEAGYRAAAIPTDSLWQVVLDPRADASARVGAAMALRDSLDGEGRARLRVAIDASASPKVRVALGAIANADAEEADLREAVEACADDAGERGREGA